MVADLEAGLNDLLWAHSGDRDLVVVVADQSAKAVEIATRACRVAGEMGVGSVLAVANRCTERDDPVRLAELLDVPVVGLPEDDAVAEAGRLGLAPLDFDPTSPSVRMLGQLASLLEAPTAVG